MRSLLRNMPTACLLLVFFCSCVDKQDFDQYDDLGITPSYEASILYIEAPEVYINAITGVNIITQNFNFDAFATDIFADRVLDGTITYEIENTTSKELEITVEFTDDAGNVLDTEVFTIQPAPTAIDRREIQYGNGGRPIDIITNTSNFRVTAQNNGDNTSTSGIPDAKITLKSSAEFRLRLK
ncbi:hypothetical protein ACEZ3G_02175 [Maribacter algicola]|uniref:Uncharacterized protein n=1 Tax=Meishania litoralis TaxID=3434685 RepID=A0ACC7LF95_9FLAO